MFTSSFVEATLSNINQSCDSKIKSMNSSATVLESGVTPITDPILMIDSEKKTLFILDDMIFIE